MNPVVLDPRVWLPALVGIVAFLPRALPPAAAAPLARPTAVALPEVHGLPPATGEQQFELLAERSTVHFLVRGPRGELRTACPAFRGTLQLDGKRHRGSIELQLDLTSLPGNEGNSSLGLHHVLGVHRTTVITYRGTLVATTRTDLAGVQQRTFLGRLYFGDRAISQAMQLWQCSLPGQPLRLQGHGTVSGAAYGLPARRWLGWFPEEHEVTLGLDLAWRRLP